MEPTHDGRQTRQTFVRNLIQRTQMMNRQLNELDIEETTKMLNKVSIAENPHCLDRTPACEEKSDFRPFQKTILSFFSGFSNKFDYKTKQECIREKEVCTSPKFELKQSSHIRGGRRILNNKKKDTEMKSRDEERTSCSSFKDSTADKKRIRDFHQRQKYVRGNCFIRNITNLSRSTLSLFTKETLSVNQRNVGAHFRCIEIEPDPTLRVVCNKNSFERNLLKRSLTIGDLENTVPIDKNPSNSEKTILVTSSKYNMTPKTIPLDENNCTEISRGSYALQAKLCDNTTLPSSTTKHKIKLIKNDSIKRASSINRTRSTKRTVTERIYELFDKYDDHKNYDSIQKYRKEWDKYRHSSDNNNIDFKNDFDKFSRMRDKTKKIIQIHRGLGGSGSGSLRDDDFPDESPFTSIKASNEFLQELRSQDDIGGFYVEVKKK